MFVTTGLKTRKWALRLTTTRHVYIYIYQRLHGPQGGPFLFKNYKKHKNRNFRKICFLVYFGVVPGVETSKKYIGASILTIFSIFKKSIFKNSVFRYFLTFGWYFDVREHYHQTRNEKIRTLSYFHNIWLEQRPEQPKTTS